MADGDDRFDSENGSGGGFLVGLLAGTVLGAGLGILFAPKSGSEMRSQLSDQAGTLANTASEGYRRAAESVTGMADKSREVIKSVKNVVADRAEQVERFAGDAERFAGDMASEARRSS